MPSGQKRPALDDANNRRRSPRPPKDRDRFHQEILVNGEEVEFRVDDRRGLHQPGAHIISDEEKEKLNKESTASELFKAFLKPEGWTCKQRVSCDEGWVYVAPGVTRKKEVPNVNIFTSRLEIYEQYEKDGHSMDGIIRRAKEAAEAESDTDRNSTHTTGVARAPGSAAAARGHAAAAAATTTATTGSATNTTSSNIVTPTGVATRPENAAAADNPAPAPDRANVYSNHNQEAVKREEIIIDLGSDDDDTDTPPPPPPAQRSMRIAASIRKLKERIANMEPELNIAVDDDSCLLACQRVERLEAASRAMVAAIWDDITTEEVSSSTDTPPQPAQQPDTDTVPKRVRKLEETIGNIKEHIVNMERELNIAVDDSLFLYQRVERLEAASRE